MDWFRVLDILGKVEKVDKKKERKELSKVDKDFMQTFCQRTLTNLFTARENLVLILALLFPNPEDWGYLMFARAVDRPNASSNKAATAIYTLE